MMTLNHLARDFRFFLTENPCKADVKENAEWDKGSSRGSHSLFPALLPTGAAQAHTVRHRQRGQYDHKGHGQKSHSLR